MGVGYNYNRRNFMLYYYKGTKQKRVEEFTLKTECVMKGTDTK